MARIYAGDTQISGSGGRGHQPATRPIRPHTGGYQPPSRVETGGETPRRNRHQGGQDSMKLQLHSKHGRLAGYLLTEALVYISVVVVILGIGYAAMYRSIRYSLDLRRSAEDISKALNVGERWRDDIRAANIRID